MIVALDNTFLSLVLNPTSKPTPVPGTSDPIPYCRERIEALIDRHSNAGDTVIIPTPCLAELLTTVPDVMKVLEEIDRSPSMNTAGFDARCAVELALETQKSIKSGDKKGGVGAGWQEVKFDRQIAVIAKVNGADVFYTDDSNQAAFATQLGMTVKHTWNLELPPDYAQRNFLADED